jgi:hypothetical protein
MMNIFLNLHLADIGPQNNLNRKKNRQKRPATFCYIFNRRLDGGAF